MLNKAGVRELCYLVIINDIKPISGRDRVESAIVSGWSIMVRKGQFKPGDVGIYFEIDSQTPATEPFAFLESKHYKIKIQKYKTPEGPYYSQGLLMHPSDFGWAVHNNIVIDNKGKKHCVDDDTRFLTSTLGVIYNVAEDNTRKANSVDKYRSMAQRNGKLFARQPFRWLMKRSWGRKLLFVFFGKKKDKRNAWPDWVKKTDEERIENMPWMLSDKSPWIATEKIDGSSTTFTMKRLKHGKMDFRVCSRNVVFDKPDKPCYYDNNIYLEMAEKYHIKEALAAILKENPALEWVTLQGETYGKNIQKREYGYNDHHFAGFNFITSAEGRWNSADAADYMQKYDIPWVPILREDYILPDTIEELRKYVHSEGSCIDGEIREGIVFRSQDGTKSFKCVDPEFLVKYHS